MTSKKATTAWECFIQPARFFVGAHVLLSPREVLALCQRRYPGHPRGCPNFGHKQGCPPWALPLSAVLDLARPCTLVVVRFDLAGYAAGMRCLHPEWTDKMCRNSRYWQATVAGRLRRAAESTAVIASACDVRQIVVMVPEAHGVNVTETCKLCGVELEWPPVKYVHKVALIGHAKEKGTT